MVNDSNLIVVKTKQQQQLDLGDRIEKVQALIDEISQEIDAIKAWGEVAPEGCGLQKTFSRITRAPYSRSHQ